MRVPVKEGGIQSRDGIENREACPGQDPEVGAFEFHPFGISFGVLCHWQAAEGRHRFARAPTVEEKGT